MAIEKVIAIVAATVMPNTANAAVVSPSDVAVHPLVQNVVVPDYDFSTQQRFSGKETKVAGNTTLNSQQTFNGQGQPTDAWMDSND